MMNTQQFISYTEAYGADIKSWPADYQQQAFELIALNIPAVQHALEQAAALDAMLASPALQAERALFDRIVTNAPQQKISFWHAWFTWYGLAGAGLAGALAGVFVVSIWLSGMVPDNNHDTGIMAEYVYDAQDWS